MPTQWVIEVRLGEDEAAPSRDELEMDGQEEVFSHEEVALGRVEHHSGEDDGR